MIGLMTSSESEAAWIPLCRLEEIEIGRARYVEANGHAYCVVRPSADSAMVFDDACPHAGQSMSGGRINDECLVCPWHAWEFRLSDGRCPDNETIAVQRYRCRINGDGWVELAQ